MTNLSFCESHNTVTPSAYPKTKSREKLALTITATITERNLQESAPHIVQSRIDIDNTGMGAKL